MSDSQRPAPRRRKHWGWGYEDDALTGAAIREAAPGIVEHIGFGSTDVEDPVALENVTVTAPRVDIPDALSEFCSTDLHERVSHSLGKSYCDVVRGLRGRFDDVVDVVARPRDENEAEVVLEWAAGARGPGLAVIPYGGGTSVCGGVEPRGLNRFDGVVSVDLTALDRVLEVDPVSRSALIQAGASGPVLEAGLALHGMTLRHFPQSFELSTLGGWIATRAGGHFATLWTHIDDFVESVRALTPAGVWESRRLPGSGAGPSPDRALIGSEGILGLITQAWMRVAPRPSWRASASVTFESFLVGAECVRALSQAGLHPSNCRLIDPAEAALTGAASGGLALLIVGFESYDHDVDGLLTRALEICAEHGGVVASRAGGAGGAGSGDSPAAAWRDAFLRAPYVRDSLVACGILAETFETATTWERFPSLHARVLAAVEGALERVAPEGVTGPAAGRVSCRFTHVYPDGPAPYYTVLAPARRGEELEQWAAIKRAASDVLSAEGATITHHHAVGRDHREWYDRQRPEPFAIALRGAKAALDPGGNLNPGVLLEPVA